MDDPIGHRFVNRTRFGSVWADPARTASSVRAVASRHGAELCDVDAEQLAACAIGADVWATVFDSDHLSRSSHRGAPATRSLAAILARASGHPSNSDEPVVDAPVDHFWLRRAEWYVEWLTGHRLNPRRVLSFAAQDLSAGYDDRRMCVAVGALLAAADHASP